VISENYSHDPVPIEMRKERSMTSATNAAARGRNAMRKTASAVVALAVLLVAAHSASASPAVTAEGSFAFLSDTVTPVRASDGNIFLDEVASIAYSGDLTGVVTATDTIVAHGDGTLSGHGTETCASCTIGGRSGSFTAVFVFSGANGHFSGTYTFTAASGGLTSLHGQGTFEGNFVNNSYAYDYHFEL
jgi:hypothetical protein